MSTIFLDFFNSDYYYIKKGDDFMTINERVKLVRKALKMNQTDFATKIGITQTGVSWLEKPGNAVIDQNIHIICEKFRVNEAWLRTGDGEMFRQDDEYILNKLAETYQLTERGKRMIRAFLSLSNDQQEAIVDSVCTLARSINNNESPMPIDESTRLHAQLEAELQAERGAASASSATSSEKRA